MQWKRSLATVVLFAAMPVMNVGVLQAAAITVNNFSFEADVQALGAFDPGNVPGWTAGPGVSMSTYHPTTSQFPGGVPDGVNVGAVQGGDMSQTLLANLTANTQYTLLVSVGRRADIALGTYLVTFEAGGSVLASESAQTPAAGTFSTSTISFFAATGNAHFGEALTIRLSATGGGEAYYEFVILDA